MCVYISCALININDPKNHIYRAHALASFYITIRVYTD